MRKIKIEDVQAGRITAGINTEDTMRVIQDGDFVFKVILASGREHYFDDKKEAQKFSKTFINKKN